MSFLSDLFGSINFELIAQLTMLAMIVIAGPTGWSFLLFLRGGDFVNFALQFPSAFKSKPSMSARWVRNNLVVNLWQFLRETLQSVFFLVVFLAQTNRALVQ